MRKISSVEWLRRKLEALRQAEGYVVPEGNGEVPGLKEAIAPLKLDANENYFLSRGWLESLAKEAAAEVDPRFYSVAEIGDLKHALAGYLRVAPERIVLGCGADQLIDFLASTFLRGEAIAASVGPSYSFYRIRAALHGARMIEIPLAQDFEFPVERAIQDAREARIFFLCSPNNPTGNQFDWDSVMDLIDRFPGLVVVDEAYAEFARYQLAREVRDDRKLIVLRTLSKSFGLAGLRIGYLIAPAPLAEVFIEKVQYPYPLSSYVVHLATKVVKASVRIREAIEAVKKERDRLARRLANIPGIAVFRSDANFILFRWCGDEKALHQQLHESGLYLKYIGPIFDKPGYLRTTVGTESMNDRLIEALGTFTSQASRPK